MELSATGFGATVTAALPEMQAMAESLMVDTCTVRYPTGVTAQDPDTGAEVPVYADRLTSKCKVQARSLVVQAAEGGGRSVVTVRLELHMPVGSTPCEPGDVAELTAVDPDSGTVLGRKLRIGGPVDKTFATAMRYEVTEVVA